MTGCENCDLLLPDMRDPDDDHVDLCSWCCCCEYETPSQQVKEEKTKQEKENFF